MTEEVTWHRVGRALLGRWPSQVAAWGEEGISAFIEELQADGLTADRALTALRMHRSEKGFPPTVDAVSTLARRDPNQPTGEEMFQQVYGPGGIFGVKRSGVTVSPWVEAFARNYGRDRLRLLEVNHDRNGGLIRKELREAYERFLEANEGRAVAEIAERSVRGSLGRVDPSSVIGGGSRREIEAGS